MKSISIFEYLIVMGFAGFIGYMMIAILILDSFSPEHPSEMFLQVFTGIYFIVFALFNFCLLRYCVKIRWRLLS